jgi:hypothetical protein
MSKQSPSKKAARVIVPWDRFGGRKLHEKRMLAVYRRLSADTRRTIYDVVLAIGKAHGVSRAAGAR